jgi:3-oxoacyl-[acyl-carrier-protein] synthase III
VGDAVVTAAGPAIVGTGLSMPEQVRTNSDPIFRNIPNYNQNLFTGYTDRRVLGPGETVNSIMVTAAQAALNAANVTALSVDLLLGYASVSQYVTPNSLAVVHAELGLPSTAQVLPVADDFTNFNSSLMLADALIRAGRVGTALIACGANWTSYVSYTTTQAISAGDGAGAAVVASTAERSAFRLVDQVHLVASQDYGSMYMAGDPVTGVAPPGAYFTSPVMHITQAGMRDFVQFGGRAAPGLVTQLMQRNQLEPADVTLICHQSSQTLLTMWQAALGPVHMLDTLPQYANIELAAIPVNLATYASSIPTDNLVLLGLGVQLHASALLLRRG